MEQGVLRRCRVFQGLDDQQLNRVAAVSRVESHGAGQSIFREGDLADNFYILDDGKVLLAMADGQMHEYLKAPLAIVEIVNAGETFGWSALVKPHLYTLSASAAEKSTVIAIAGSRLWELMDHDPTMGYHVMKGLTEVIASRLGHTRNMLLGERGYALLSQAHSF